MNKYKFLEQYENMIEKYAQDQETENKLYDLLNDIDDKLIELETKIADQEEISRQTLDYEQMNEDFVYLNCI